MIRFQKKLSPTKLRSLLLSPSSAELTLGSLAIFQPNALTDVSEEIQKAVKRFQCRPKLHEGPLAAEDGAEDEEEELLQLLQQAHHHHQENKKLTVNLPSLDLRCKILNLRRT